MSRIKLERNVQCDMALGRIRVDQQTEPVRQTRQHERIVSKLREPDGTTWKRWLGVSSNQVQILSHQQFAGQLRRTLAIEHDRHIKATLLYPFEQEAAHRFDHMQRDRRMLLTHCVDQWHGQHKAYR